jgi:hypothetical protein
MTKEEAYHIQRAKKKWAVAGDGNTTFFHQAIVKRNRKNRITHLTNPDGSHSTTPEQLTDTLVNYFTNIFSSPTTNQQDSPRPHSTTTHPPEHVASTSNNQVTAGSPYNDPYNDQINQIIDEQDAVHRNDLLRYTYSIPNLDEIHELIRKMRSTAAPGPDGLNAAFYKSAWSWVKDDVYAVVKNFYTHVHMPSDLNETYITLIPKTNQPAYPQDYRPISLCNVIYKIITKSLANRLKHHLSNYVSQA